MDRKKQIAALTDDEGERLLLAQACERLTRAEQRGIPAATVFLTPREQALLRQLLPLPLPLRHLPPVAHPHRPLCHRGLH